MNDAEIKVLKLSELENVIENEISKTIDAIPYTISKSDFLKLAMLAYSLENTNDKS